MNGRSRGWPAHTHTPVRPAEIGWFVWLNTVPARGVLTTNVPAPKPDWQRLNELTKLTREALAANPQMKQNADRLSAFWMSSLKKAWAAGYPGTLNAWKQFVERGEFGGEAGNARTVTRS